MVKLQTESFLRLLRAGVKIHVKYFGKFYELKYNERSKQYEFTGNEITVSGDSAPKAAQKLVEHVTGNSTASISLPGNIYINKKTTICY